MRMTIGNVVRTKILMVANYAAKDTGVKGIVRCKKLYFNHLAVR